MTRSIKEPGMAELEQAEALFVSVFSNEPWSDDWSDEGQLPAH